MVRKRAEIALCVGIKSLIQKLCDNLALYFQTARGNVHNVVKPLVEIRLVFGKVSDTGHIYGNDADRACGLAAAEEAAGLFAQLSEVETQTAAHGAHVAGLHVGVYIVGEVRRAVL